MYDKLTFISPGVLPLLAVDAQSSQAMKEQTSTAQTLAKLSHN